MSITFRNTIRLEECAGKELMSEKPCDTGFHGGGGQLLKAQQKCFTRMIKKTQVNELVLMCIKSNKST